MRFSRNKSCGVRKGKLSNRVRHLVRFSRNKSCGVRKGKLSNEGQHFARFVRNRSCGVRKCKNAHLSMRVFRCLCPLGAPHSRRAPASRLPPRCAPCAPASRLPPRCVMRRLRPASRLIHPAIARHRRPPRLPPRCAPCAPPSPSPSGEGVARRFTARDERGAFAFIPARRPARPFINHQNKKPRHSVLRVFLHSHINKTKNAAPRAPLPLRKAKDGAPCGAPISHNKSKRYVYFFPFQQ